MICIKNIKIYMINWQGDPFYAALYGEKELDIFIDAGKEIIKKKTGNAVLDNPRIKSMFELISCDKYKDCCNDIKVFILLSMMIIEDELVTIIEKSYDLTKAVFEERGPSMMRKTILVARERITSIKMYHYNVVNIIDIIERFVKKIKNKYIKG